MAASFAFKSHYFSKQFVTNPSPCIVCGSILKRKKEAFVCSGCKNGCHSRCHGRLETAQIEACRYAKKRKDRVKHDKVMKTAAARKKGSEREAPLLMAMGSQRQDSSSLIEEWLMEESNPRLNLSLGGASDREKEEEEEMCSHVNETTLVTSIVPAKPSSLRGRQRVTVVQDEHDLLMKARLENAILDDLRLKARVDVVEEDFTRARRLMAKYQSEKANAQSRQFAAQQRLMEVMQASLATTQQRLQQSQYFEPLVLQLITNLRACSKILQEGYGQKMRDMYIRRAVEESYTSPFLLSQAPDIGSIDVEELLQDAEQQRQNFDADSSSGNESDSNRSLGRSRRLNSLLAEDMHLKVPTSDYRYHDNAAAEIHSFQLILRRLESLMGAMDLAKDQLEALREESTLAEELAKSLEATLATLQESASSSDRISSSFQNKLSALNSITALTGEMYKLMTHNDVMNDQHRLTSELSTRLERCTKELESICGETADDGDFRPIADRDSIEFHPTRSANHFPQLKAASVERLVEALTYEEYRDTKLQRDFLLTYKVFMTPAQLLERLALRYCLAPPLQAEDKEITMFHNDCQLPVRSQVLAFLKSWISCGDNALNDKKIVQMIEDFLVNTVAPTGSYKYAAMLVKSLKRRLGSSSTSGGSLKRVTQKSKSIPVNLSANMSFIDFNPEDVARQLTLIEHGLFVKIRPHELLNQCWTKRNKEELAPNIVEATAHFNRISLWVVRECVTPPDCIRRSEMIKKFIDIANCCLRLRNMNAVFEITSALGNSAIHRMRKTWEIVGKDAYITYARVKQYTTSKNHKDYRAYLSSSTQPCVPYLGVSLTDLIFIDEGNSTKTSEGLINFQKMGMIASVIEGVQQYQREPYTFPVLEKLEKFLLEVQPIDDEAAYQRSLKVEPREMAKEATQWEWSIDDETPDKGKRKS